MAKLAFSKLDLKKNNTGTIIHYNDQEIEVKQYLPINEKIDLVATVLNNVVNSSENRFANTLQMEVFTALGIIEKYTNITFTEKQKADFTKLYDLLKGNGLATKIIQAIPEEEYNELLSYIYQTVNAYYNYQNSIFGILDSISKDYSNLELDAEKIKKALGDGENVEFLKEVLTKLG